MRTASLLALALLGLSAAPAAADTAGRYRVTITNVTANQTFTPIIVATHRPSVALFEAGQPASDALEDMAEGGSIAALLAALQANPAVAQTRAGTSLLAPGQSFSVVIRARRDTPLLSLAGMLIPTNDSFVAIDGVRLPERGSIEVRAAAYDAGTEPNSELCADIPGPFCGGAGTDLAEDGEGFVHISRGISGAGEGAGPPTVTEALHDWRNPVAEVTIRRLDG